MGIYLCQILIIIILGLGLHPNTSRSGRKVFLWTSFVMLTLISGFRDVSVGVDTHYYVSMFENIDKISFATSRFENGFLYFLSAIHWVSSNVSVFLLASSCICIGLTCVFLDKHCDDVVLGMLLYVLLKSYFAQMALIRQSIATAIVMIAFSILLQGNTVRRKVIAALVLLLASSIHTLAIAAFVPYVVWVWPDRKIVKKLTPRNTLKYSIILMATSFVLFPLILRVVGMAFPQYVLYFTGIWGESNYVASLFKLLIQFAFLIVGVYYFNRKEELSDEDRLGMLMIMISVVVLTLSMRMEIWGRLAGLFTIYTALLWAPSFAASVRNFRNRRILKTVIFLFSLSFMIITFIYRPEWDGVVPYLFRT